MILRIKKSTSAPSWKVWASKFVRGGLPLGRRRQSFHFIGVTRRHLIDPPKHLAGPRKWYHKFRLKLVRPLRGLLHLAGCPSLFAYEEEAARFNRDQKLTRVKTLRWSNKLAYFLGWPTRPRQLQIKKFLHRWLNLTTRNVVTAKLYIGYRRVCLFVRGRYRFNRWAQASLWLVNPVAGFRLSR